MNASLSATNTNQNAGDLNPTNPNISTTAANVMFFQAAGSYGGNYTQGLTSDGTCCSGGALVNVQNTGGTRMANLAAQYGPVPNRSGTVTSYTLTMGGSMSFTNHSIADALTSP